MENPNPAVSVLIPMYNAEKFIGDTLTSIADQTLQDFEVIVVDDCSTDNSRAVVENFFDMFGDKLRLIMLSKNSRRIGIPRNFALSEARGKYVFFMDSDDILSKTALEDFYRVAENFDADVVHSEKCLAFPDGKNISSAELTSFQKSPFVTKPTLETFDIAERVIGFINEQFVWWPWDKLYRRKFLLDNAITFPPLRRFEDFVFILRCVIDAKNYVRVPFVNYFYRVREGSTSHKSYDAVTYAEDLMEVFTVLDELMSNTKFFRDNPQYQYRLLEFFSGGQLNELSKGLFGKSDLPPDMLYSFFRDKLFARDPQDNVALTAYLFVAVNLLTLRTNRQAVAIDEVKKQLEALKTL